MNIRFWCEYIINIYECESMILEMYLAWLDMFYENNALRMLDVISMFICFDGSNERGWSWVNEWLRSLEIQIPFAEKWS